MKNQHNRLIDKELWIKLNEKMKEVMKMKRKDENKDKRNNNIDN